MEKENDLKRNLLKQMDNIIPRKSPEEIIAKDMIRVRRIKWATIISWALTVSLLIGMGIYEKHVRVSIRYTNFQDTMLKAVIYVIFPTLTVIRKAMVFVSVFFTIAFYIRSRILGIKQIHVRLSRIEEQLKNIAARK